MLKNRKKILFYTILLSLAIGFSLFLSLRTTTSGALDTDTSYDADDPLPFWISKFGPVKGNGLGAKNGRPVPCDSPRANGLEKIPEMMGVFYVKSDGNNWIHPTLIEPLKKVGKDAWDAGYAIGINTACRPYKIQKNLAEDQPEAVRLKTVAEPGKSYHGFGLAIDIYVYDKAKKILNDTEFDRKKQCSIPNKNPEVMKAIRNITDIFTKNGWMRLGSESWHYEFGTNSVPCRSTCNGYAAICESEKIQPSPAVTKALKLRNCPPSMCPR